MQKLIIQSFLTSKENSDRFLLSTCVLGLVSIGGAAALGRTAAEVTTAAGPFPTVAMIWPWVLRSNCGVTVWTWRPWRGREAVAAPPAREAGLTNSGRVPIIWREKNTYKSLNVTLCGGFSLPNTPTTFHDSVLLLGNNYVLLRE